MKSKIALNTFLFFYTCTQVFGQSISPSIIKQYPASVAIRVYEVASKIVINEGTQKAMAVIFFEEDNTVLEAINNKKEEIEIAHIHQKATDLFYALLKKNNLDKSYFNSLKEAIYPLAKASAQAQSALVVGDSLLEKDLTNLYFYKYLETENAKRQFKYSNSLTANLKQIELKYDSLLFNRIDLNRQDKYFTQRILQLDQIKPLSDEEISKLRKKFYSLSYERPIYKSFADHFNESMPAVVDDTVYYAEMYRDEIESRSSFNARCAARAMIKADKLPYDCYEPIYSILYSREKKLTTYLYAFPQTTPKVVSDEIEVRNYYDSLLNIVLYHEGVNSPDTQFFIAVRYRNDLKLTAVQVDTLVNEGFKFEELRKLKTRLNDVSFNYKSEERNRVKRILSENQFFKLISLINQQSARNNAFVDWQEMKSYGLVTSSSDSINIIRQLTEYHLSCSTSIDYYKDDARLRADALRSVDASRPSPIRQLEAARKLEAAKKNKIKEADQLKTNNTDTTNNTDKTNNAPLPNEGTLEKQYRGNYQW